MARLVFPLATLNLLLICPQRKQLWEWFNTCLLPSKTFSEVLVPRSCTRINLARSVLVLEEVLKESREPGSLAWGALVISSKATCAQSEASCIILVRIDELVSADLVWFSLCKQCIRPAFLNKLTCRSHHHLILISPWTRIVGVLWHWPSCFKLPMPCLYLTNGGVISLCHRRSVNCLANDVQLREVFAIHDAPSWNCWCLVNIHPVV